MCALLDDLLGYSSIENVGSKTTLGSIIELVEHFYICQENHVFRA
ncbi:hypothetical protein DSUL_20515 [Desulfovibrionales bacterium]